MAEPKFCAREGCRNRIKKDETYCYLHKDGGIGTTPLDRQLRRKSLFDEAPRHVKHGGVTSTIGEHESSGVVAATMINIDSKDAAAIYRAADEFFKKDMTVPMNARESVKRGEIEDFRDALVESGINENRITIRKFDGLKFFNFRISRMRPGYKRISHRACIIDEGKPNEVVVDPFLSAYCMPPKKSFANKPVAAWAGSGTTPFGERPWVGTVARYMNNSHLEWERYS